jgi:DnaJ-class molecular chaperone
MKCECEECRGTGRIECPECNGRGQWARPMDSGIEHLKLERSMHNYEELVELQKDAKRCMKQAAKLSELNPARKDSYAEQLRGCLFVINGQAEKAAKRK